jgi:hypothetical protein
VSLSSDGRIVAIGAIGNDGKIFGYEQTCTNLDHASFSEMG